MMPEVPENSWRTPVIKKYCKRTKSWYAYFDDVEYGGRIDIHHVVVGGELELALENRGKNWREHV